MGEEKKISQTGTKDSGYGWGFVLWWHTELVQKVGHQARERYSMRQKMRNNMLYLSHIRAIAKGHKHNYLGARDSA